MAINKEKLKEFILFIREMSKITSVELLEKDFYLNYLLSKLDLKEYIFKGGTCLAKVYLDYFRFSEDLDFTFNNQDLFAHKSTKSIKKICKEKIDTFGKQIETLGLDFVFDKSDRKYVELGNNNKLVTFKIWYDSVFTGIPSFVKIQINYLETIRFEANAKETMLLIKRDLNEREKIYFQEFLVFYQKIKLNVYDIKEITAEKFRSILTRKNIKSRDAVDIFFIYKTFGILPEDLIKEIKEKITFSVENYEKYRENLTLSITKIEEIDFPYDDIKYMVTVDIRKADFDDYINKLKLFLQKIIAELKL